MIKVLVVDDEVEITEFLCNFLGRFNLVGERANNGKAAMEMFTKIKPQWVLLDIKMPDMDGFEVLEELRKIDPAVKAIMITGVDDRTSQERAKKLGAVDYVVKPLDLEDLHAKIKLHILKQ